MLNHAAARYSEVQVRGDEVGQAVLPASEDGEKVSYPFLLSRQ